VDSPEGRRQWADRTGEYSPTYYADYGADGWSEAVLGMLDRHLDRDAAVLELGCSSGRHLAHLHEHGYENLTGIDVNEAAFEVMAESFPATAAAGTFHAAPIETVLAELPDDRFDAVFSVETLQHLPPASDWVFETLGRVTAELLVTVENEGDSDRGPTGTRQVEVGGVADNPGEPATDGTASVDGVPLYHRDWEAVFTGLGLEQVGVETGGRNTVRAFRPPTRTPGE
jgi:SAM-dependent methyltransferase